MFLFPFLIEPFQKYHLKTNICHLSYRCRYQFSDTKSFGTKLSLDIWTDLHLILWNYLLSRRELFVERRLTFVESLQIDLLSLDPFQHKCLRLVLIVNSLHELLRKYLQLLVLYHNFRDLKYKIVGRPDVGLHDGYLPPWLRWDQRSMF